MVCARRNFNFARLDDQSMSISMKYDAINVTTKQLLGEIFDLLLGINLLFCVFSRCSSRCALDLDRGPLQKHHFASTSAHAINLSPTLAGASVGGTWRVASVRCQVAVRSGEWQVSGVRWRCAVQAYV